MIQVPSFPIQAFNAIHFLHVYISEVLFFAFAFSLSSKYFLKFSFLSHLTHGLFRSGLFNCQVFRGFPVIFYWLIGWFVFSGYSGGYKISIQLSSLFRINIVSLWLACRNPTIILVSLLSSIYAIGVIFYTYSHWKFPSDNFMLFAFGHQMYFKE